MKRIATVGLIGLLGLLSQNGVVHAADKDKAYAPKGAATLTCEGMSKINPNSTDAALVVGWFDGYVTGLNMTTPETFDIAPWQDSLLLSNLVLNACRKNPQAKFMDVVQALTNDLAAKRLKTKAEVVEISEGDKKGLMYSEVLKQAQTALKDRAGFSGTADGKWGSKTRDAIKAFQKKEGLPETGLPDSLTLLRLLQPFGKPGAAPAN